MKFCGILIEREKSLKLPDINTLVSSYYSNPVRRRTVRALPSKEAIRTSPQNVRQEKQDIFNFYLQNNGRTFFLRRQRRSAFSGAYKKYSTTGFFLFRCRIGTDGQGAYRDQLGCWINAKCDEEGKRDIQCAVPSAKWTKPSHCLCITVKLTGSKDNHNLLKVTSHQIRGTSYPSV